jgi:S-adenosylmethionine decarboxylase
MARVASFFQLGTDLDPGSRQSQAEEQISVTSAGLRRESACDRKDYFIERDGLRFAGVHLIIDLHEAERLDDLTYIERTLRDCITASGASLLHIHLHHFTPNGGVSGVAVLAESHISVHTWPECGYAAFDVFMCGNTKPHRTVEVLKRAFRPGRISVSEHLRGGEH